MLLAFPLTIAVAEALIVLGLWTSDWLSTVVTDLMPLPAGYEVKDQQLVSEGKLIRPDTSELFAIHRDGLSRGATLSGAIPLSLGRGLMPRVLLNFYTGQMARGLPADPALSASRWWPPRCSPCRLRPRCSAGCPGRPPSRSCPRRMMMRRPSRAASSSPMA